MFKIDNHRIGSSKVFIIAEIGINHNGNIVLCKKLVKQAKLSGADAVKLQISNPEYSYEKNTPSYKIFKKNKLSFSELKEIKKFCKSLRITLFATPGDFQSLEFIKKLNFPAIKISSGLMTNEALIREATKLKKPIIFSTGLAFKSEIKKTALIFKKSKNKNFAILKCTSLYPCPEKFVNLNSLKNLQKEFPKIPIGYSDHTKGIDACVAAAALGAKIIEKHITLKSNFKAPDKKVSIEPNGFKELVKKIRLIEKILGKENIFPNKLEIKKRSMYHRSIITVKNISKGEVFTKNNIALKRSLKKQQGLHPKYFFKIIGKKSKVDLKRGISLNKLNF